MENNPQQNPEDTKIQLTVKRVGAQNQEDSVKVKVKPGTQFSKLFRAVRERFGLVNSTISFVFDGKSIQETDTPRKLDMEDEDLIEIIEQY